MFYKNKKERQTIEMDSSQIEHAQRFAQQNIEWEDVPFYVKAEMISYWQIVIFIANILQIISALMTMFIFTYKRQTTNIIIGFSCFFTWSSFTKYVEYDSKFSFITRSIEFASGTICKNIIFCLPIMFGFAFFGLAFFY